MPGGEHGREDWRLPAVPLIVESERPNRRLKIRFPALRLSVETPLPSLPNSPLEAILAQLQWYRPRVLS